ncbi:MAG TPA: hypothetical protein VHK69_04015 [Chitinophagaceae bacterium]|nr:hypothetical protein [Chitinophagaceae bacterium]
MTRNKEHLLRSSIAFVLLLLFLNRYCSEEGCRTLFTRLFGDSVFSNVLGLIVFLVILYLAFGPLRSGKRKRQGPMQH